MTTDDHQRLVAALAPIEHGARGLTWAAQRPWATATHVWQEGGTPVVDLHDLSVALGVSACRAVLAAGLDAPVVIFVTGRGRRSGGVAPLSRAVLGVLDAAAEGTSWRVVSLPGRVKLVFDPARDVVGVPWVVWLVLALMAAGVAAAVWEAL